MYSEEWSKKHVRELLEEYKLKVSANDFNRIVKLQKNDKDAKWIISNMKQFNESLTDVLISYICY